VTLTTNEKVFLNRTAAVMAANPALSIEDAMREVLARDEALWLEVATRTEAGNAIASAICEDVYKRARGEA
jgi:hypothetical protein